ncbi:MAG: hypothetical protein NVSMB21_12960 [Vulcanimicrobiaceae bacterium]
MNARVVLAALLAVLSVGSLGAGTPPAGAQSIALPEPVGMAGDAAARLVLDGNAAFLHGDLTTAARDYRQALRAKPDLAVARFNLGLVELHANAQRAGARDMDRGIALATAHGMSRAYVARLRALRAGFVRAPQADA